MFRQRTNASEDPSSFAQKLFSVAANFDLRASKKHETPSLPFDADETIDAYILTCSQNGNSSSSSPMFKNTAMEQIVAFFSKTPPPPRLRRPRRFQKRYSHNRYNKICDCRLPFRLRKNY